MGKIILQLCRAGDVMGLLPLLKDLSDSGQRSSLMVHKQYASILEGVSYCDCIPFDGDPLDLPSAYEAAHKISSEVQCLQVLGSTEAVKKFTYEPAGQTQYMSDSFVKEPYRLAKRMDLWVKQPPLVFDWRNPEREARLVEEHIGKAKKPVLISLGGVTSPFPYKRTLLQLLKLLGKTCSIIDITEVRSSHIFDLLGMYERACCLIASDSAHLHLAQACPNLPVIALATDKPQMWHGSALRPNHVEYVRYGDFAARAPEILSAIKHCLNRNGSETRNVHVWSEYDVTDESRDRHLAASITWPSTWTEVKCPFGSFGRDSHFSKIKDPVRYPFLSDVIRVGAWAAKTKDEFIILTRADTLINEARLGEIDYAKGDSFFCYRTLLVDGGEQHVPLVDLFAFTVGWWEKHQAELPPLILGTDYWWNRTFLGLMVKHGAKEIEGLTQRMPSKAVVKASERQKFNENAHSKWQDENGIVELIPSIEQQVKVIQINRHSIAPAGYNPCIIRFKDRLLMSYRWHTENKRQTQLSIAELDPNMVTAVTNREVHAPPGYGSQEDAQLFEHNGELWIAYVDSTYPAYPPKCVTRYGRLVEDGLRWVIQDMSQPVYGLNDMTALEKNWRFFSKDGSIHCFYQTYGEQIILKLEGSKVVEEIKSPALRWKWGPQKGGTAPIAFEDGYFRFFHSTLDNEAPPNVRRYYIGAMRMDIQLGQRHISCKPICRGSDFDFLTPAQRSVIHHHKPKVLFPIGCIQDGDDFIVSCGVNDSACALLRINQSQLNL